MQDMLKKFSTEKENLIKGKYLAGLKEKIMQKEEDKGRRKNFLRLLGSKALI